MATVYACYISGNYQKYFANEYLAEEWASSNGEEFAGSYLSGAYSVLRVTLDRANRLLTDQPCLGHDEALTY